MFLNAKCSYKTDQIYDDAKQDCNNKFARGKLFEPKFSTNVFWGIEKLV